MQICLPKDNNEYGWISPQDCLQPTQQRSDGDITLHVEEVSLSLPWPLNVLEEVVFLALGYHSELVSSYHLR